MSQLEQIEKFVEKTKKLPYNENREWYSGAYFVLNLVPKLLPDFVAKVYAEIKKENEDVRKYPTK